MMNYSEMTVTIKLKSFELQSICETINRIKASDSSNTDTIELDATEKHLVSSVFKRLAESGKRKADRLEMIGNDFKNSLDFANCK